MAKSRHLQEVKIPTCLFFFLNLFLNGVWTHCKRAYLKSYRLGCRRIFEQFEYLFGKNKLVQVSPFFRGHYRV